MDNNEALSLINQNIRNLKAYHLTPYETPIKLNQNENPFDWPAEVKEEVASFCKKRPWNRYPHFIPENLKEDLAAYAGVAKESVIIGNGSNEMLLVLLLSLVSANTKVVICQPTFTVYRLLIDGLGAQGIVLNLDDQLQYDKDAICRTVSDNPGAVLILCSPNNPTGSALDEDDLRSILALHKGFCILDQAYVEFGGFNATTLLPEFPNLIITRTFSKAFAGAGLRLGYMLGNPEVIGEINKIKLPYNINFFSEHVASVLMKNRHLLAETIDVIKKERDGLYTFLKDLPFEAVYPSAANFILVRVSEKQRFFDHLCANGILIRDVSSYPLLDNCLRISIGTPDENRALKEAMTAFFG